MEELEQQQIIALEHGVCADPFGYLGVQYNNPTILLRVWKPAADSVSLLVNEQIIELEKIAADLFVLYKSALTFELDLTKQAYKLAIRWGDVYQEIVDPYMFHDIYPDTSTLNEPLTQHYEMGAQLRTYSYNNTLVNGVRFLVFAPHAKSVAVVGDFNYWDGRCHPLQKMDNGLWGLFIPDLGEGVLYKYEIHASDGSSLPHKADPWGYAAEQYPSFASKVVAQNSYKWQDNNWQQRFYSEKHTQPISIYELHVGSWQRNSDGSFLNYRQLAQKLIPYIKKMGFTHIELMPISEYPYYGSWGYQPVGLFAPTSRFGSVDDFKYFIDQCHQQNIGVLLDWVPAHFPADSHGLAKFDGTDLYTDPDPRRGWHQDWNSYIYDYNKEHVRRFLVANALFWLDIFHIDGIRVDAVASMLYLDYSRKDGQWLANEFGGNHNLGAIDLIRWLNLEIYKHFPNAMTIAEESTAFNGVSRPVDMGGLGFGFKWNMGWMHDSLNYFSKDPVYRKWEHNTLTFPLIYAFSENYVLSLSHDEVVYGKGSIASKMPGDEWQQMANLRAYYGYMFAMPGKKLNFMGFEFGQISEWDHEKALDWQVLDYPKHQGVQSLITDLNHFYISEPALYQLDSSSCGFAWRVCDDNSSSVLVWERIATNGERILCISNLTPTPRYNYKIGVPYSGSYQLGIDTDSAKYWGSGFNKKTTIEVQPISSHGLAHSISLDLPPLSTMYWIFIPT